MNDDDGGAWVVEMESERAFKTGAMQGQRHSSRHNMAAAVVRAGVGVGLLGMHAHASLFGARSMTRARSWTARIAPE